MNPVPAVRRANVPMPPPTENPPRRRSLAPPRLALAAFILCAGVWLESLWRAHDQANAGWLAALFTLLALATTLISLARALPVQNVLSAAALTGFMAAVAELINVAASMPFGPRKFTEGLGPRCFGVLPWAMPLVWVVALLNSRGVARLILRPWRKTSRYGFWVIGLTAALTVVFDLNVEPFAVVAQRLWVWWIPGNMAAWHGAPFYNFIGWLVVSLLILAFVTPWLINKNPGRKSPPDYHPLVVWLAIILLPAAGCAAAHIWSAAGFGLTVELLVTAFAVRGAKW